MVATKPHVGWAEDITKLRGSDRGVYVDLYVILDIYSRYVVGWTLAPSESGELAKDLIADCLTRQHVTPGTLLLHADRGTSMTSKSSRTSSAASPTPRVLRAVFRLRQPRTSSRRDRPARHSLRSLRHRLRNPSPTRRHP